MEERNAIKDLAPSNEIVTGGTGYNNPEIKRAVIGSFQIYEVSDVELSTLKDGDDGGVKLNIAISSLSFSASLLVTYLTCDFASDIIKGAIACAVAFTLLIGITCIVLYIRSKKKTDSIYYKIISRKS